MTKTNLLSIDFIQHVNTISKQSLKIKLRVIYSTEATPENQLNNGIMQNYPLTVKTSKLGDIY